MLAQGMIQWVSGDWSAATSIEGDVSGATADVADFVSPSYGVGDKVIWGVPIVTGKQIGRASCREREDRV